MLKVLVACGCGMGSSQMMKMKAQQVFKKHNIEVSIEHTSIEFAKGEANNFDVVLISEQFLHSFKNCKSKIIGLKNILSVKEIETKLMDAGIINA